MHHISLKMMTPVLIRSWKHWIHSSPLPSLLTSFLLSLPSLPLYFPFYFLLPSIFLLTRDIAWFKLKLIIIIIHWFNIIKYNHVALSSSLSWALETPKHVPLLLSSFPTASKIRGSLFSQPSSLVLNSRKTLAFLFPFPFAPILHTASIIFVVSFLHLF